MSRRRVGWIDRWAERVDRRKGWDKVSKLLGLTLLKSIQDTL